MREAGVTRVATYASDPLRLRDARRWIGGLVLEAGFTSAEAHDLAVAFSEACANVHRHAYGGRRDGRVGVHIVIDGTCAALTLDHDGDPFDPARYAPPDLRRPAESGYGLYLISSLVDEVSFTETETGGRIVLIKRRREAHIQVQTETTGGGNVRP